MVHTSRHPPPGVIHLESSMEAKYLQRTTTDLPFKSNNYRTMTPVVDMEWSLSGLSSDETYTWRVHEQGDLTSTGNVTDGNNVFVGSNTATRSAARAVLMKLGDNDLVDPTAYGSVTVRLYCTCWLYSLCNVAY